MQDDLTVGDLVGRVARNHFCRRRLAASVGTHQRVNLAALDLEIDATQDLLVPLGYLGMEVTYL